MQTKDNKSAVILCMHYHLPNVLQDVWHINKTVTLCYLMMSLILLQDSNFKVLIHNFPNTKIAP